MTKTNERRRGPKSVQQYEIERWAKCCGVCGQKARSVRLDPPFRSDIQCHSDLRWEHDGRACIVAAGSLVPKYAALTVALAQYGASPK